MESREQPGGVPLVLEGARADRYVALVRELLRVARPGAQYPEARRLDQTLSFLSPGLSHGTRRSLEINPLSGLPTLGELKRVRADADLTHEFLREFQPSFPERVAYHRALSGKELVQLSCTAVRLVGKAAGGMRLEAQRDMFHPVSGALVRWTVRLVMEDERHVPLQGGLYPTPKDAFVRALEEAAGAMDEEQALLMLAQLPALRVEEVVRGQLGPVQVSGSPAPPALAALLEDRHCEALLHLCLGRAGSTVARDCWLDPFARPWTQAQGIDPQPGRDRLGYRLARERRLCCTPGLEAPLRQVLSRLGAKVVVRSR